MPWTREKIDDELTKLEARAPAMVDENPDDGDFWSAWAGEADSIVDNAGADDYDHVQARLSCILGSLGMIPSDNEGEACADGAKSRYEWIEALPDSAWGDTNAIVQTPEAFEAACARPATGPREINDWQIAAAERTGWRYAIYIAREAGGPVSIVRARL